MFEINITPKDIDKYVKQSLLNSVLGSEIKKVLETEFTKILDRYDSPIKTILSNCIKEVVNQYIKENIQLVHAAVAKYLSHDVIDLIITNGIHQFSQHIKDYNDR